MTKERFIPFDPRKPRRDETIGGGFFVVRRGDSTGRVRPARWPFEHATLDAAIEQAKKHHANAPTRQYDVCQVVYSAGPSKGGA